MKERYFLLFLALFGLILTHPPASGALTPSTSKIAAGQFHSLAIKPDGSLWAWGDNGWGQLGLGDNLRRYSPALVGTATNWTAVAAGSNYSLGIRHGSLWAWGFNGDGQLGVGDYNSKSIPTRVGNTDDWVVVAAGLDHSLGLRADGSLWAWGSNSRGQLGLGNYFNRANPTQVGTDTDWVAVAAGEVFSLGLRADGTLWAWGYNADGALGIGTASNTDQITPIQVGENNNWSAVAAGETHSLGLRGARRSLYAWGNNTYGQLGLANTFNQVSPTFVSNDWATIAAGGGYSLGLRTDGSLWAWGYNSGALGQGDYTDRSVPTQIGTATDWVAIAAGQEFVLGFRANGSLWAWGYGFYGQLGLGPTITGSLVPLRVPGFGGQALPFLLLLLLE